MSQIPTKNQKVFLFIMGFLCYALLAMIVLSLFIPLTLSAFGSEAAKVIKGDLWFNLMVLYPFLLVWFLYFLWATFTCHLNLKQKLIWCFALFALNIIAIPCFFHHMLHLYKGAVKNYSPKIIQSAENFLACHGSDKTLLSEQQWQILLRQIKMRQSGKILFFLSPILSGFMFFASIYGYTTLLYIKETHALAFPFMNAEIWNSSGPAEQWKFTIVDFWMVCTIGISFSLGIHSLMNLFIHRYNTKKQLNTLSTFLPKINH